MLYAYNTPKFRGFKEEESKWKTTTPDESLHKNGKTDG
jgi:hypothetical protein